MLIFASRERRGWLLAAQRTGNASELVGWGKLVFQNGWHALTIGKGVRRVNQPNLHALPGGQGRATQHMPTHGEQSLLLLSCHLLWRDGFHLF